MVVILTFSHNGECLRFLLKAVNISILWSKFKRNYYLRFHVLFLTAHNMIYSNTVLYTNWTCSMHPELLIFKLINLKILRQSVGFIFLVLVTDMGIKRIIMIQIFLLLFIYLICCILKSLCSSKLHLQWI